MITLAIGGHRVGLWRRGSGPAVLLVHGLGGPPMWDRAAELLSTDRDVLIPHLPGFGESPPPAVPLTMSGCASLIGIMLGELGVTLDVLAGISWGGEIAAAVAAGAPELVKELVLVCPTGARRYPWYLRSRSMGPAVRPLLRAALANGRIAGAISSRSFHDISARPPGLVDRYLEHLRRPGRLECLVSAAEELRTEGGRLPGLLERVRAPLTLVWGENDATIPPSTAEVLMERRPDARLILLPHCGHSAALERPQELARIVRIPSRPAGRPGQAPR